jgi:hypothetical protein
MAASQDECVAQFPRQPCCNDRVYSRLISWAGYITNTPLPPTGTAPDVEWVRQRVLAEQLPATAYQYVTLVGPYLLEVPQISQRIRDHLNAWNDETTETALAADIDSGLAVVMPKIADSQISDGQVANWCEKNGYPVPPGLLPSQLVPGMMTLPMGPPPSFAPR